MSRPSRVRHVKRGSEYRVLGEAELQVSTPGLAGTIGEGDRFVVYRGGDGKLWLRAQDEFDDGRFQPAAAPEDSPLRDELARILEIVASEGLAHPRSLDAALDAIGAALRDRADELLETTDSASGPYYHTAFETLLEGLV